MPIYEYECEKCGHIEEVLQKISDAPLCTCTHCSGKLHKLVSHSSFHLKGTGWYVTDYKNKSATKTEGLSPQDNKENADSKGKTDTTTDTTAKSTSE